MLKKCVLICYYRIKSELTAVVQNVRNSSILEAGLNRTVWLAQAAVCARKSVNTTGGNTRRGLSLCQGEWGELLYKMEYASWHSKYVCLRDRRAKYTYCMSDQVHHLLKESMGIRSPAGFWLNIFEEKKKQKNLIRWFDLSRTDKEATITNYFVVASWNFN